MYFILPDKIVGVAPRVGSRSTRAALDGFYTNEYGRGSKNLQWDRPVVIFVREPLERFISGFRLLFHARDILINYQGLVDAVLEGRWKNAHITPQAHYHDAPLDPSFPCEVRLYPFENINQLWDRVVGVGKFPRLGGGAGPLTEQDYSYREDEVKEWLKVDYELRRRLVYAD